MCGICGLIHFDGEPVARETLRRMNERLRHRGPDGEGMMLAGPVGLAMRRLKIIDVDGSDQPLQNEDGHVSLIFNGEIYNHRDLRRELGARGHRFTTAGDGETIAHLYEEYGDDALSQLRGMFALALWDARRGRLLLARDRFGQKPLYFYQDKRLFAFASEIKALMTHPEIRGESRFCASDARALAEYLSYGYIPAPATAFRGIRMLEPARLLSIDLEGQRSQRSYWELPALAPPQPKARIETWLGEFSAKLDEAVTLRLMSDVPLGAFLSGGLDSSLIVALMRRVSQAAVKTFSIGFAGDDSFDETAYAEQVARHLGTEHQSFRVQPQAIGLLSDLVWHHDQPFADSSAIPTYLVSKLTRQHVTVALTGDGGDELFVGYERFHAAQLMRRLRFLPYGFFAMAANLLGRLPEGTDYYDVVKRARRFMRAASLPWDAAYFDLLRVFNADLLAEICPSAADMSIGLERYLRADQPHQLAALAEANTRSYLPDDLLIKADRCSMQASLEARAPFLDHELAEFVARIPFNLKLKGGRSKHILKAAARETLPEYIIERKKHGFGIPLGSWLRHDIKPAREILLSRASRERGLLNMAAVERLLAEHQTGMRDHNRALWALLTLEEWHRQFVDADASLPSL